MLDSADADSDDVLSLEEWQDAELPANYDQLTSDDLFTFADAGADGLQPADGKLTLDEVIHALHPDTSARLRDYQRVVARRVLQAHDGDGDMRLNQDELASLHMVGYNNEFVEPEFEAEFRIGAQSEAQAVAKHNLELYDTSQPQDGQLDIDELGAYLVPQPAELQVRAH